LALGFGLRFIGSTFTTGIIDVVTYFLGRFSGQSPSIGGFGQPIFSLTPFYQTALTKGMEIIPLIGPMFASLSASTQDVVVSFLVNWILIGSLALAFFASLGKWISYFILAVIVFLVAAIMFGAIKL
jgi:hypothetical protein